METLKILIADDEQSARELILHYLDQAAIPFVAMQAADGRSAFQLLESKKPDILFLDIKMPEMSGIEVLQQRERSPLPVIIFTTAFDEFALPAFDYEAIDYLLKPFEKERFDRALEKAINYIRFFKDSSKQSWLEKISIKKGIKTMVIPVIDIEFCQSDGAYVQVNTGGRSWLMNVALYELESKLDPSRFVRIHKSVIVNITSVKELSSLPNGDTIITLKSGKQLRGSRTYKMRLKDHFNPR